MIAFYRNLEYRPHPLAPSPAGEGEKEKFMFPSPVGEGLGVRVISYANNL